MSQPRSALARAVGFAGRVVKRAWQKFKDLPPLGKAILCIFVAFDIFILVLFIVFGPKTITQSFYDFGQKIAHFRFGWLCLGALLVVLSFPPLVFYFTIVSLCGFTYGIKGFLIAGPASIIGSAIAFVVLRFLFRDRLRSWTAKNEKWQALESVIREKGLPLMILIRISPFPPWVYQNAFFASIEAVSLWQFVVATIFLLPKVFLVVFVGSRIAKFSDGTQREHMDRTSLIINIISTVLSIAAGVIAGIVTFRLLKRQINELRESRNLDGELAAEAIEAVEESAPLLRNHSSDSEQI